MRLFTGVFPPDAVVRELTAALAPVRAAHPGLRWVAPGRLHVTLRFHGDDAEPGGQLDALAGLPAPTVRLAGCGHFSGVLWIGVEGPLEPLAAAAGTPLETWRPHLTVARARGRRTRWPHVEFTGREWTVREVALVRSDPATGYEVLDRVPLSTSNAPD
ncbi:2'-5' RNA ligase family protein [Saccharothrix sp. NPDC042600]|uniref:2'-5' RNA ligase family protein n=1 Tax=Saccharothrix TaxID=2071 RepID=UPI0033F9276A|nr:RNA 2',3'-cyclic phosphodiesterase [Saccharothrix mutabilis subsp. capreolus]